MRKSRSTEEQIVGILKVSEAELATAELCRKHGINEQRFYRWKAKCGGLEVSNAQRLRQLSGSDTGFPINLPQARLPVLIQSILFTWLDLYALLRSVCQRVFLPCWPRNHSCRHNQ